MGGCPKSEKEGGGIMGNLAHSVIKKLKKIFYIKKTDYP